MSRLPTLFVSHGAPTFAIDPGMAGPRLTELGRSLPRPKAVLIVSPHWMTPTPQVGTAAQPGTAEEKLGAVILRVFSRAAAEDEVKTLAAFLAAQEQRLAKGELDPAKSGGPGATANQAAWALTIRALLNTDEFVTKN